MKFKEIFHLMRRQAARLWLKTHPKVEIIGITGSYGKTYTTLAINSVLSQRFKTLQTDLNLDTLYNLPITILKLRPEHQFMILEMGVDHRGEMDFHLDLVKPKIGVLTGITYVHSDSELLGSIDGVIEEKKKLLESLPEDGYALINNDDPFIKKIKIQTKAKILKYGTSGDCDLWADQIKIDLGGISFCAHFNYLKKSGQFNLKVPLMGKHFVQNCLAAIGVGLIYSLTLEEIKKGLEAIKPLDGRLSLEKGPRGTTLLNDYRRANPASTLAGLETLVSLPSVGRKIAVLGEMGELGDSAKDNHRMIGEKVANLKIDFLISIGPWQKVTAEAARKQGMRKDRIFWAANVEEAGCFLKKILEKGDLIYLKGSLLKHLERIIFIINNQKVNCRLISCHHYHDCSQCSYLQKA